MVSVLIVNWNTRDLLLGCLESLQQNAVEVPLEIIVFDNASSDGSVEAVRERFPSVKIMASPRNLGFAAANNRAFQESSGEFILLLNPDTVVPPGALKKMVDFLNEHPEVGLVGPLIVSPDGRVQPSAFGIFPGVLESFVHATHLWRLSNSFFGRRFLVAPEGSSDWCYASHLLGACLMVRRKTWEDVQGMDTGYFLFLEETDLCYRASLRGWRCALTSRVQIIHYGEQSVQRVVGESHGLYIRSYNRFCKKAGLNVLGIVLVNTILVLGVCIESLKSLVRGKGIRTFLRISAGLWFGYFRKPPLQGCEEND